MNRLSLFLASLFLTLNCLAQADDGSGWTPLFDGKTLEGWAVQPSEGTDGHWKVVGDEVICENVNKVASDLWTTKTYHDYEMELEYKTPSKIYDTGVYLRGAGHQVQIGISSGLKCDLTACIYAAKDEHDGSGYPVQLDKVTQFNKLGEWNHLRIVLTGKRIQTFLNGEAFVDYEGTQINDEGPIGLQLHAGHHMKIHFRNVKVKELNLDAK